MSLYRLDAIYSSINIRYVGIAPLDGASPTETDGRHQPLKLFAYLLGLSWRDATEAMLQSAMRTISNAVFTLSRV